MIANICVARTSESASECTNCANNPSSGLSTSPFDDNFLWSTLNTNRIRNASWNRHITNPKKKYTLIEFNLTEEKKGYNQNTKQQYVSKPITHGVQKMFSRTRMKENV